MRAFPIDKSFTAVVVLLVALTGWGQAKEETKEVSREKCKADFLVKAPKCNEGDPAKNRECRSDNAREADNACADYDSKKEMRSECTSSLAEYRKSNEKIKEQCERAGKGNTEECKKLAKSCGSDTDIAGLEGSEESEGEAEKIFKTVYGISSNMQGITNAGDPNSCLLEDDEKESTKKERLNEKISKLRSDISSLKEDVAKADDDVAKKKQEVEEKILELEKEMDKKDNERKTEAQKETLKMQQEALDAIKRKKASLKTIEDKNRIIANLRLVQQEEAIKFSQTNLMKACRDQALELKAKYIAEATKALAAGTQGTSVTGNIKKDVETFAKQCVKLAAVEKTKALKATQDKITFENSNIKDLQDTVKLDDQAAANRQKDLEARNKLVGEEQTKAEEKKTKELGQLSQKVTDIQALVEKKKITLAEKAKAKEDEINQLLLELSNKKPKFKKISSDISVGSGLASEFAEKCCPQKTGTGKKQTVTANADSKFKRVCEQLEKDFPDETKPAKSVKQKKAS